MHKKIYVTSVAWATRKHWWNNLASQRLKPTGGHLSFSSPTHFSPGHSHTVFEKKHTHPIDSQLEPFCLLSSLKSLKLRRFKVLFPSTHFPTHKCTWSCILYFTNWCFSSVNGDLHPNTRWRHQAFPDSTYVYCKNKQKTVHTRALSSWPV